jgi:hypothetical protein
VFSVGPYRSSCNGEADEFIGAITSELSRLVKQLRQTREIDGDDAEELCAAKLHSDGALRRFAELRGNIGPPISHTTCFGCLYSLPIHTLYCGHVICQQCMENYSQATSSGLLRTLVACPLCNGPENHWAKACTIEMRPPNAGVRILSLDGWVYLTCCNYFYQFTADIGG